MQVLIAISGFCGFCSRIGNAPCTTPFDFLFVISIHVLAWGTTTNEAARLSVVHISIHVPAWGTTKSILDTVYPPPNFNPRSREGNDQDLQKRAILLHHFNPRSRVGNDSVGLFRKRRCLRFQSTFPRGERQENATHCSRLVLFQSTFPRGERLF